MLLSQLLCVYSVLLLQLLNVYSVLFSRLLDVNSLLLSWLLDIYSVLLSQLLDVYSVLMSLLFDVYSMLLSQLFGVYTVLLSQLLYVYSMLLSQLLDVYSVLLSQLLYVCSLTVIAIVYLQCVTVTAIIFSHGFAITQYCNVIIQTQMILTAMQTSSQNGLSQKKERYQSYWAKGTGFGTGSTTSDWDAEKALVRQRTEEDHLACLLQVLHLSLSLLFHTSFFLTVLPVCSVCLPLCDDAWHCTFPFLLFVMLCA